MVHKHTGNLIIHSVAIKLLWGVRECDIHDISQLPFGPATWAQFMVFQLLAQPHNRASIIEPAGFPVETQLWLESLLATARVEKVYGMLKCL